jgi:hypothetical protein
VTRRSFLLTAVARPPLIVPVRRVIDKRANCTSKQWQHWWNVVWPEAVREFDRGGIRLQVTDAPGEIKRLPSSRPAFDGLARGTINLVITDHVPMDYGGVAGVTTRWEGYDLCVIAVSDAHANQVPYFSVNTCVHELLHLLLQDLLLTKPKWYEVGEREFRIDYYATRLWLFHDGEAIRKTAEAYLRRLQSHLAGCDQGGTMPLTRA